MLRKTRLGALFALVALVATAAFAPIASATPDESAPCSECHGGANVPIATTLVSTIGGTATYNFSAMGADAVAIFNGSNKLTVINSSSGTFMVPVGSTRDLYAVAGPGENDGLGTTSVSPVGVPVDTTAPVTTSDAQTNYVGIAAIYLTATDSGSGVANTYYRVDGGSEVAGTAIVVSALGSHTITFWSVDVAGNIESPKTATFTVTPPTPVDTTAPVTTSDAVATYVDSAAITLTATDGGSGVAATYYTLDGGSETAGTAIAVSTLGSHTITFFSVDVAGNIESPKTATFTITEAPVLDTTAPVTTSDAVATYVDSAAITLTATDGGSGVAATYYTLDGGSETAGTAIAVSTLGSHTITFFSVDVAGNIESPKTATFTITEAPVLDTTAPVTTSDAVATYVDSAAITLTATDGGSGVAATYYTLDGGSETAGTAIAVSTLGSHTITFFSVDVAGNIESPKTATFTITEAPVLDTTAPVTTSDAVATYVDSAAITLTATDGGSGVAATYYTLDGGSETAGTAIAVSTLGSHTITFFSVDVAGNIESPKTATFTITEAPVLDTTAPVTTSDAVATYVDSAAITLTATDGGSGVAATYYTLDGGSETAGTAIAVSALGSHTITFFSVDVAGNIESPKTATFTITEAPVPSDAATTTLSIHASYKNDRDDHGRWYSRHKSGKTVSLSGKLTPGAKDLPISLYVMKHGSTTWELVKVLETDDSHRSKSATWNYRFTPKDKGSYKLQVKFAGNEEFAASESQIITVRAR